MEKIQQYIPLLVPVILIELALMITALVDLIRRAQTRGPKWVWALVIVLVNFIGPIIYFVAGRKEE
ncbi:MAG: PLD nuclease N-terminal domain-containing protein [Anaerolineales bacterium]|nr:PLD nuclease N-terminal domain-containing protein [Anaerolineales bacterium]